MNDTILNSRQNHILKILKERGDLSRLEISRLIPTPTIPIVTPTIPIATPTMVLTLQLEPSDDDIEKVR